MTPIQFYKCLADETRLTLMLLIQAEGELCVCEMTHALDISQPKVSRHLAQLRGCALLQDRRQGQWVYYRLAAELPDWAREVLTATARGDAELLQPVQQRLATMGERPQRQAACC